MLFCRSMGGEYPSRSMAASMQVIAFTLTHNTVCLLCRHDCVDDRCSPRVFHSEGSDYCRCEKIGLEGWPSVFLCDMMQLAVGSRFSSFFCRICWVAELKTAKLCCDSSVAVAAGGRNLVPAHYSRHAPHSVHCLLSVCPATVSHHGGVRYRKCKLTGFQHSDLQPSENTGEHCWSKLQRH